MSSLRDSPEWEGVTPIEQDDGKVPVVRIAYSPEFKEAMGYFRYVLSVGELSERAFALTGLILDMNPANYTVWKYRRDVLHHLGKPVKEELEFVDELAGSNPKNYQIWFHRRELVEKYSYPDCELAYVLRVLEDDAKNYHAWSHRQWVLKKFDLWEGELEAVEKLLEVDCRNNSAWNQRWFVLKHREEWTFELRQREVDYALNWLGKAVNNESPWNYIRGLVKPDGFARFPAIEAFCRVQMSTDEGSACPFVVSMLADIFAEKNTERDHETAYQMYRKLADEIDIIRRKFWHHKISKLEKLPTTSISTPSDLPVPPASSS